MGSLGRQRGAGAAADVALSSSRWACSAGPAVTPRGATRGCWCHLSPLGTCAEASSLAREAVPALRSGTWLSLCPASAAGSGSLRSCSVSPGITHWPHGSIPPPCSACGDAHGDTSSHGCAAIPSRSPAPWGEGRPVPQCRSPAGPALSRGQAAAGRQLAGGFADGII